MMTGFRRSLLMALLALLLAGLCAFACAAGFSDTPEEMEKAAESVVKLTVYDSGHQQLGWGSGFFLFNDRTIITNYHVIKDGTYVVAQTDDGILLNVNYVLVCSEIKDLAILQLKTSTGLTPLTYSTVKPLRGSKVVAIGSPLGIKNQVSIGAYSGTITVKDTVQWLFNAAISSGSSGGALFNNDGQVIGVTSGSREGIGENVSQNLNYSISIQQVVNLYRQWDGITIFSISQAKYCDKGSYSSTGTGTAKATPKPTATVYGSAWPIASDIQISMWTCLPGYQYVSNVGNKVSMSSVHEGEFLTPRLALSNNTSYSQKIDMQWYADGKHITFSNVSVAAGKTHYFCLAEDTAKKLYSPGTHSVTIYIDGKLITKFQWTVTASATAKPTAKPAAKATAKPTAKPTARSKKLTFSEYGLTYKNFTISGLAWRYKTSSSASAKTVYDETVTAKQVIKVLKSGGSYGLNYRITVKGMNNTRNFKAKIVFVSPDGYEYTFTDTIKLTSKTKRQGYEYIGDKFFTSYYKKTGTVKSGKYSIYLYLDNMLVNVSTISLK